MRPRRSIFFTLIALAAASAAAGTADVRFADPASFADAGGAAWERDANLQTLARHFGRIAQQALPANQVLKIVVLDVDLAGMLRPTRRATEIRVLRGGADFPRIHLQYALEAEGKVELSGDEWLTDLNYTRRLPGYRDFESLPHEKRMIDEWFKARFAP